MTRLVYATSVYLIISAFLILMAHRMLENFNSANEWHARARKANLTTEKADVSENEIDDQETSDENTEKAEEGKEDPSNSSMEVSKKLPSIGVVGVKKCGTGALIEVLRMHPGIVAPPYAETEIRFWGEKDLMDRGLDYYKVTFEKIGAQAFTICKIRGWEE